MRIFLIGFMGAGKSYWGKLWANHHQYAFVDLDLEIASQENETIVSIFEKKGEDHFRQIESEILRKVNGENIIISCGGGTPCFNNNIQWMNENGITVYLNKNLIELHNCLLKEKDERPVLKELNENELYDFIEKKLNERSFFYNQAKFIVNAEEINIDSLNKILKL